MDWEQLREKTLGEVGTSLVAEGAGVTAGFIGAAIVGRQIQNRVKSDDSIVSGTDKIMAWSANNLPKVAMWYLLRKYATVEPGEALTPMKEATVDAKKAISGSIIYDTIIRLANGGRNPGDVKLWGYQVMSPEPQKSVQSSSSADIQRLIQENSALRAELNKALQRLATPPLPAPAPVAQPTPQVAAPPPVQTAPMVQARPPHIVQQAPPPVIRYQPVTPPVVSYTPAPQPAPVQRAAAPIVQVEQRPPMVRAEEVSAQPQGSPAISDRERKYGFMQFEQTPPEIQERERKFGFMKSGGEKEIASMFGML